jgi:hypothetical protein
MGTISHGGAILFGQMARIRRAVFHNAASPPTRMRATLIAGRSCRPG